MHRSKTYIDCNDDDDNNDYWSTCNGKDAGSGWIKIKSAQLQVHYCYLRYSWYLRYLASTRASDRASTRASTRASLLVVDQLLVTQHVAPDHSYHSHCLLRSFPQRVALAMA